jgi:hypothetical protein
MRREKLIPSRGKQQGDRAKVVGPEILDGGGGGLEGGGVGEPEGGGENRETPGTRGGRIQGLGHGGNEVRLFLGASRGSRGAEKVQREDQMVLRQVRGRHGDPGRSSSSRSRQGGSHLFLVSSLWKFSLEKRDVREKYGYSREVVTCGGRDCGVRRCGAQQGRALGRVRVRSDAPSYV